MVSVGKGFVGPADRVAVAGIIPWQCGDIHEQTVGTKRVLWAWNGFAQNGVVSDDHVEAVLRINVAFAEFDFLNVVFLPAVDVEFECVAGTENASSHFFGGYDEGDLIESFFVIFVSDRILRACGSVTEVPVEFVAQQVDLCVKVDRLGDAVLNGVTRLHDGFIQLDFYGKVFRL